MKVLFQTMLVLSVVLAMLLHVAIMKRVSREQVIETALEPNTRVDLRGRSRWLDFDIPKNTEWLLTTSDNSRISHVVQDGIAIQLNVRSLVVYSGKPLRVRPDKSGVALVLTFTPLTYTVDNRPMFGEPVTITVQ